MLYRCVFLCIGVFCVRVKVKVKVKVKVGLFVTYTIIQSTISSEMQGFLKKNTA